MIDRPASGTYDDYAEAYAASVASREQAGEDPMGILPVLLALLGDLAGHRALDAGCGEGLSGYRLGCQAPASCKW
jgi:hypothetical protein